MDDSTRYVLNVDVFMLNLIVHAYCPVLELLTLDPQDFERLYASRVLVDEDLLSALSVTLRRTKTEH
eukprot:5376453-Amphidinium_carterae.1